MIDRAPAALTSPGQPTLRTPRFVLRPFVPSDAPEVQRVAGTQSVADTTLTIPHPYPEGAAAAWIATHRPGWESRTQIVYAVIASTGALFGAVGLNLAPEHRRGELGYWVAPAHWNLGVATEAAAALMDMGFQSLDLNRVQATHFTRNAASGRVMQKLGMRFEGVHRQYFFKNGRFEDVARYAMLRSEWQERRESGG